MPGVDMSLPKRLIDAIHAKRLLIVCGAGISMAPPSSLPSWWGFNKSLFEAMRDQARKLIPDQDAVLRRFSIEGSLPVTAFSDLVVRTFAGDGYFPLLTALEGALPNANHEALAELVNRGIVSDIVTFNFDTLIEQAFRERKTPLRVLVRSEDYDQLHSNPGRTALHKVHGSVTDSASLVDTVTQKLQGLSPSRRIWLEELFGTRHVLFVGFSGADFDFDSDYVPMTANAMGGLGFTWLHRSPKPAVSAKLTDPTGVFLEGALPDFFQRLGISLPAPPPRGKSVEISARIEAWAASPQIGPWNGAAFFQALAHALRDDDSEKALNEAIAREVRRALLDGPFDLHMLATVRRLAVAELSRLKLKESLGWSAQELLIHEKTFELLTNHTQGGPSPGTRLEYLRNTASVFSNIGSAYGLGSDPDRRERAKSAFDEALARARAAEDDGRKAIIRFNLAQYVEDDPDSKLRLLRVAIADARAAGNSRTLVEATFAEARLLVELGELDLALAAIARLQRVLPVAALPGEVWECTLVEAGVAARRGSLLQAMRICETVGRSDPLPPERSAIVASRLRRLFSADASMTPRLRGLLSDLGDAGAVELTPRRFAILETGDKSEDRLRLSIALSESGERRDGLPVLFEALAGLQYSRGANDRLLDAAFALRLAAERAMQPFQRVVAQQYSGIAQEGLGNLAAAVDAFAAAVAITDAHRLQGGQQRANLAGVLWRLGEYEKAETLYSEALDQLRAGEDWTGFANASVNFGRCLVRAERRDDAVACVTTAAAMAEFATRPLLQKGLEQMAEYWAAGGVEKSAQEQREQIVEAPEELDDASNRAKTAEELGNLAILEIEAGELDAARDHIAMADQNYKRNNDLLGQARCLGNLAQLHSKLGAWDDAIAAQRASVALREKVGALDEQLRAEANLATLLHKAGRHREAVAAARAAMRLAPSGSASWPFAQASFIVVVCSLALQRWFEARQMIPISLAALKAQSHPERDGMVATLERLHDELGGFLAARPPAVELSPEAVAILHPRIKYASPSARVEKLRQAAEEPIWSLVEQATFWGEAGNTLFDDGQFEAAFEAYDESERTYRLAGHPMAWHAKRVAATQRQKHGEIDRAETDLVDLIETCTEAKVRAEALVALANSTLQNHAEDSGRLATLRVRLEKEWLNKDNEAEQRGQLGIMLCQAQYNLGEKALARATFLDAKSLLVSCNSRVLTMLPTLEAALAAP